MLVFAGLTPHSPLLLESISKDQAKHLESTTTAMKELADDLYAAHPDTILLISQHPTMYDASFSINLSDPYEFDLRTFGELGFDKKLRPEIMLVEHLQRYLRKENIPITLTTDEALDYSAAVPLHFLTERLPKVKLIPITYSKLGPKAHFQFGQALKDVIFESNERIAIIASGDLSHALTSEAPAGYFKEGEEFDKKIQELIIQKNTVGLVNLNDNLVENAHQTIYNPLLILFGLLERISVNPQILSYEAPFGVGYLVTNFVLR